MTEEKEITETNNGQNNTENNEEPESDLETAIIRQVEYYFGDMNLIRDKFLRSQIELDEGWVPFDVLVSFNRLAKLSTDTAVIVKALGKSSSGLLEMSDDNKKVRRSLDVPLPEMNEERRKELMSRTVYAKGFPKDSILDDLLKYFKGHGDIETVIMRRYLEKVSKKRMFKGSVFVTFKTKEQADLFLEKKDVKYEDNELLIMTQEAYIIKKQEEFQQKKEKREKKNKEDAEKPKDTKEFKLPTGTVFRFTEASNKMSRENIKEALEPLGAEIAYVEFKQGESEGYVRLTKENAAKEVMSKITDGKLKIGESEVLFTVLEGEEETAYLAKTVEEMSKRRKSQKAFSKQNKGRNYKGRGQGRKRRQENSDDGPPNKIKADV